MWIFTEKGFISVVSEPKRKPLLTVRSRDIKSLVGLTKGHPETIVETPMADYPFRTYLSRSELTGHLADSVSALKYPNFKNQVALTRGKEFSEALYAVWVAMMSTEEHLRNFNR